MSFYFYLAQFLIPHSLGLSQILVEIIIGHFRFQISLSAIHTYSRQCRRYQHLFILGCVIVEFGYQTITNLLSVSFHYSSIYLHSRERLRETSTEIQLLVSCPTIRESIATYSLRVYQLDMRIESSIPIHGFCQIQQNG